jgi:dolichol kinase
MKPAFSLGAILAVAPLALAAPAAKDDNLVNPVGLAFLVAALRLR